MSIMSSEMEGSCSSMDSESHSIVHSYTESVREECEPHINHITSTVKTLFDQFDRLIIDFDNSITDIVITEKELGNKCFIGSLTNQITDIKNELKSKIKKETSAVKVSYKNIIEEAYKQEKIVLTAEILHAGNRIKNIFGGLNLLSDSQLAFQMRNIESGIQSVILKITKNIPIDMSIKLDIIAKLTIEQSYNLLTIYSMLIYNLINNYNIKIIEVLENKHKSCALLNSKAAASQVGNKITDLIKSLRQIQEMFKDIRNRHSALNDMESKNMYSTLIHN